MKFLYIIVALSLLAMMIPAMTVSVSAADVHGILSMSLVDGSNRTPDGTADVAGTIRGYNVLGSIVEITSVNPVTLWSKAGTVTEVGYNAADWVSPPTGDTVQVQGYYGEISVYAKYADNNTDHINKKWGPIDHTAFTAPNQTTTINWSEANKKWFASGTVTDNVYGKFIDEGTYQVKAAQGAILNWYLVSGDEDITSVTANAPSATLKNNADLLDDAKYTQFVETGYDPYNTATWAGTYKRTISGVDGSSSVNIAAWFMEKVYIVVIPEYPNDPNRTVTPEIATYNFSNNQTDIVPQVRWAGEKIVLEAVFGLGVTGDVVFTLQNHSVGSLEAIGSDDEEAQTVEAATDNGTASVVLTSDVEGQADVTAALYDANDVMMNQYRFRVYFLNFYSLTLGDVVGKRAQHNAGLWTEENPFNTNFPDNASDPNYRKINVSQDALERAQVKGWFMPSGKLSLRGPYAVDLDGDGSTIDDADMDDVLAPAGHYVLPDDWQYLMTSRTFAKYWDIMDDPSDDIMALATKITAVSGEFGPYKKDYGTGATVTDPVVVGPFAPGIEIMTSTGWQTTGKPVIDPLREYNTIVPNGTVDAWDAPMPPAKITFSIVGVDDPITPVNTAVGFFKEALKTDIYYYTLESGDIAYTAPFYATLVPAHEAIPAFNKDNGGHYDWNSFNKAIGPYNFWQLLSRNSSPKPTSVEVYSDNHGEAMVWLNGDNNVVLTDLDEGYDTEPGVTVGMTTVIAEATYPYAIVDKSIYSNTNEKEFTWGGMILGMENNYPYDSGNKDYAWYRMVLATGAFDWDKISGPTGQESGDAEKRMVWVWLTNRDGLRGETLGAEIEWTLFSADNYRIPNISGYISEFNLTTQNIFVENGFLSGTKWLKNTMDLESYHADGWRIGYSKTKAPSGAEIDLFNKFYGTQVNPSTGELLNAANFSVAAIEVSGPDSGVCEVQANINLPREGNILRVANLDFKIAEKLDDPIKYGDANGDGEVNMADVVSVERMILGLDSRVTDANAYWNCASDGSMIIDMADVIRIEKIILTGN